MMKRSTALMLLEVFGANPNGNFDLDNRPHSMPDGRGWMSDGSMKSKIRATVADHDMPYFQQLQEKFGFDPERFHVAESLAHGTNLTGIPARDAMFAFWRQCQAENRPQDFWNRFFDARIFGGTVLQDGKGDTVDANIEPWGGGTVLARPAKKKVAKAEKGEKLPSVRFHRTGCVTIKPAFSIAPIETQEITITKQASLRDEPLLKNSSDVAPQGKKFVVHGLYAARISVNPNSAKYTYTTDEDIEVFKFLLKDMFAMNTSVSRPAGSMNILNIWWQDHTTVLGSFNEFKFWSHFTPTLKDGVGDPISLNDYNFPTAEGWQGDVVDLMG